MLRSKNELEKHQFTKGSQNLVTVTRNNKHGQSLLQSIPQRIPVEASAVNKNFNERLGRCRENYNCKLLLAAAFLSVITHSA